MHAAIRFGCLENVGGTTVSLHAPAIPDRSPVDRATVSTDGQRKRSGNKAVAQRVKTPKRQGPAPATPEPT